MTSGATRFISSLWGWLVIAAILTFFALLALWLDEQYKNSSALRVAPAADGDAQAGP